MWRLLDAVVAVSPRYGGGCATSPFVYEEPVAQGELVGRQGELALLLDRATASRNSRLEGPRRFGKTSLLRAVLASAAEVGMIPIEVSVLGCVSAADVADRIERAYRRQLDGPLRRWFDGVIRRAECSSVQGSLA